MMEANKKLIGIEVTNQFLKSVCLNEDGDLIDTHDFTLYPETDLTSQIIDFIHAIKTKFGDFQRIGIAVSGLVDRRKNHIALSEQFSFDKDLAEDIKKATGIDAFLENDANSAAYGEYTQGAGRESQDMFYVLLSSGVGGALVLGGQLWRGNAGFAGEFGHLAINSEGMRIDEMASEAGILRRTRNRIHQDSTSSLYSIGEGNITVADIVEAAKNEDDFAKMMLERTGMFLGKAIGSVINLLNIEKIIIGGKIMEVSEVVLQGVNESIKEFAFAPSVEATEIVAGELGENAVAIGVALLSSH
jgi:glucokinase